MAPEIEISLDESLAIRKLAKSKGLKSIGGIESDADVYNFGNEPVVLYFRDEKQFLLTSDKEVEELQSAGIIPQEAKTATPTWPKPKVSEKIRRAIRELLYGH